MSIRDPQRDLRLGISGGSDAWDDGLAGELLSSDYFTTSTPPPEVSRLKYWTGSSWQAGTLKAWNGSAWQSGILKRYDGSNWVE